MNITMKKICIKSKSKETVSNTKELTTKIELKPKIIKKE